MSVNLHGHRAELAAALMQQILPLDSPLYCDGQFSYDWELGTDLPPCEPGSYEKLLRDYFTHDPGSSDPTENLMIVVGGIGTGKTTAIRRAISQAVAAERKCSLSSADMCVHEPRQFILDFRVDEDKVEVGDRTVEEEKLAFWNHVASELETKSDGLLAPRIEVTTFWNWCLGQKRLLDLSPTLYKELSASKLTIRQCLNADDSVWPLAMLLRTLFSARERLVQNFTKQDLAWYNAYIVKFATEQMPRDCRCNYLFLDNVDQLHPDVQRLAVETTVTLSEVLRARAMIAIRPLTFRRSVHGYNIIQMEKHRSPSVFDVLKKRIDAFIGSGDLSESEAVTLRAVLAVMTGDDRDPLLRTLVDATSGYSIRFALRNFSNMFDAPTLASLPESNAAIDEMHVSRFAKAFLCGERTQPIPHAFESLYSVDGDARADNWLVKPRLLDILCRQRKGSSTITQLMAILQRFGYSEDVLRAAVNDLLVRTRPLVWCDDGIICRSLQSTARIAATPIGWRYYRDLFGEVYYDEVCYPRDAVTVGGIRGVYEFHQKLTDQDVVEAVSARERYGSIFYYGMYASDTPGLSVIHARRMLKGIPKRIKQTGVYDSRRDEWVADRLRAALGQPPTRAGLG
jgi:hypothetical protein